MDTALVREPVLVVSIDGLAPRHISRVTMPRLTTLARQGASCFSARTVSPTLTLPAHMSMFRGIDPATHGVLTNTPEPPAGDALTFLAAAKSHGLKTAGFVSWLPLDAVFEPDAFTEKLLTGGGYGPLDDFHTTNAACALLARREHDIVFVYLTGPDVDGHSYGWDSPEYVAAATRSDVFLGRLLDASGAEAPVVVTTDHGGLGKKHWPDRPEDLETFVVVRTPRIEAPSSFATASILDIAPTIADLAGFPADPAWEHVSLIGTEADLVDELMNKLATTEHETYGENVTMLDHALQSAALARANDEPDTLVLACLLHDLGHVMGPAGSWGLPGHADVGARALQPYLDATIVEPIRLHVDAKRYRVAVEPEYLDRLSHPSLMSLYEQGDPFTAAEADAFALSPFANEAVRLREYDDDGKVDGLTIYKLEDYRPLVAAALAPTPPTLAAWARDSCRCPSCRDAGNDQHLLDITELQSWTVVAEQSHPQPRTVTVRNHKGETHDCIISSVPPRDDREPELWDSRLAATIRNDTPRHGNDLTPFISALSRRGIALVVDVPSERNEVLRFGSRLGFVRETNYGNLFNVEAEPEPINLAFTPVGLPLHTDNPYRDPCPTVQLLHCLAAAATGGESRFADGFAAAAALRQRNPEAFSALTTTNVEFRFHDGTVDLRARRPLIALDEDGEIVAIAVNHRSMEAPAANIADRFYAAYASFAALLASDEFIVPLTLEPGELIAFDNRRVLHGREGFVGSERRHLQGCYIDIDAVHSLARVAAG